MIEALKEAFEPVFKCIDEIVKDILRKENENGDH